MDLHFNRNNEIGLPVNEECKHNIVFKKADRFKKIKQ